MSDPFEVVREHLADRYAMEREIGRGGMAFVYLARDLRHGRRVAVKVPREELTEGHDAERFLREIRITAGLSHPHLLPLLDSGRAGPFLYYVLALVEGETLKERLAREPQLPLEDALDIAAEVADGLSYAHDHGVIHRDVKPSNIMLEAGHARVTDFGAALWHSGTASHERTASGIAIGTAGYMSPEQCAGSRELDGRSDIYSVGCVLHEMLTGQRPFESASPVAEMARHLNDTLPAIGPQRPDLPAALDSILARAMAKAPADRYASAADLRDALRALRSGSREPLIVKSRGTSWLRLGGRVALAALLGAAALVSARAVGLFDSTDALAPSRVVVFPLVVDTPGMDPTDGEDVSTAMEHALAEAGVLSLVNGATLVARGEGTDESIRVPRVEELMRLAKEAGAGYLVDGRIVAFGDSATVFLRLWDLRGDTVAHRESAAGSASTPWKPAIRAANALLPTLIGGGDGGYGVDFLNRGASVVGPFLQGEREFRRARPEAALEYFRTAFERDSTFAPAAIRGAMAAVWTHNPADELIEAASRLNVSPSDRLFLTGLGHLAGGRPDPAVESLDAAILEDSSEAVVWLAKGEVYRHLTPRAARPDSIALHSFQQAYNLDPRMLLAQFHILEWGVREDGLDDVTPRLHAFQQENPDSPESALLGIMERCARGDLNSEGWHGLIDEDPLLGLIAAKALAVRGSRLDCARDGFAGYLTEGAALRVGYGFPSALRGLHNVLVAQGREKDAVGLLAAAGQSLGSVRRFAGRPDSGDSLSAPDQWDRASRSLASTARALVLIDGALGMDTGGRDAAVASTVWSELDEDLASAPPNLGLWPLGIWEASQGFTESVQRIAQRMELSVASGGDPLARVAWEAMVAHAAFSRADTTTALRLLAGLSPEVIAATAEWHHSLTLGFERLLEARLLVATGSPLEALAVAGSLDADALGYLLFLPASLEIRMEAAESLGRRRLASRLRDRLAAMKVTADTAAAEP